MVNEINAAEHALHRGYVVAVSKLLELNPFGQILRSPANHVVAADDLVTAMHERVGEMAAKKTSNAGNKNFHWGSLG